MNKKMLKKYADLIVNVGVNVQKGQDVIINASVNNPEFVKFICEAAYKAKARNVTVEWNYDPISKLHLQKRSLKTLKEFTDVDKAKLEERVRLKPCMIYIDDSDPNAFDGVAQAKLIEPRKARYPFIKPYIDALDNRYQWTIVAMPSVAWAKKIFPNLPKGKALKKLEEAIIYCTRLDGENPTFDWMKHIDKLQNYAFKMNEYNFDYLTYKSSNGTNFKIGLQKNHNWLSARETHLGGIDFSANMPTEEVFTMPAKFTAEGIVYATKPLSYNGNLIEDFNITFKDGKAIKVEAKVGQEHLEEMIKMDESAPYLGEVALVPFNSPINETGILFYNTLFDENACCHLALGASFKNCIKGYENMTEDDFKNANFNDSMIHVDFMIGSSDLSIVGTTHDGKEIEVFKNGVWAI